MRRLAIILALSASSMGAQRAAVIEPPSHVESPLAATSIPSPPDYVIGPDDVLQIMFWRDKELSGEVTVRPDGKISVPLLNDVHAAGLTPEQLGARIVELARRFLADPNATVVVKAINSRKVFITGAVEKPGTYLLTSRTTVLQLIATAGGLKEYAKSSEIRILRNVNGQEMRMPFHFGRVVSGKNHRQNVELKPGDTIVVP